MNILQRIFTDYYEEIKYTLHPRSTEMENGPMSRFSTS